MPDRVPPLPPAPAMRSGPAPDRAAGLRVTPVPMTRGQRIRMAVYRRMPHSNDFSTLFVGAGRRELKFNWRNPFAIPFIVLLVVLSPVLLVLRTMEWIATRIRLREDERTMRRSGKK